MYWEWFRWLIFLAQSYQNTQDQFVKKSQRILIITSVVVIVEQIFNYLNNDKGLRVGEKFNFYAKMVAQLLDYLQKQWESQNQEDNIINAELCNEFNLDFILRDQDFDSYFEYTFGVSYTDLSALEELFLLRDMLLHGHVYDFNVNWRSKGFYEVWFLLEWYWDKKRKAIPWYKTPVLWLNLFPEEIGDKDMKICCLVLRWLIRLVNECSERKLIFNSHELNLQTNQLEPELDLLDQFIDFL